MNLKNRTKQLLSLALTLMLCVSMLPVKTYAKSPDTYKAHTPKTYTVCPSHTTGDGADPGEGEYTTSELFVSNKVFYKGDVIEYSPETYNASTVNNVMTALSLSVGFVFLDESGKDITPDIAEVIETKAGPNAPNGVVYQKIRITSEDPVVMENKGGAGPTGTTRTVTHPKLENRELGISDRYSDHVVMTQKDSVPVTYSAEDGTKLSNPDYWNEIMESVPDEIKFSDSEYTFTLPSVSKFAKGETYISANGWGLRDATGEDVSMTYIQLSYKSDTDTTEVTVKPLRYTTVHKEGLCFYIKYASCPHPYSAYTTKEENRVDATCGSEGSYEEVTYCADCGKEIKRETKTIKITKDHTPGTPVKENVVAATCTSEGSYEEVTCCSVCGEELSRETKTTEKLVHTWKTVIDKAATKDAEGISHEECTVCGAKQNEGTKISKLPSDSTQSTQSTQQATNNTSSTTTTTTKPAATTPAPSTPAVTNGQTVSDASSKATYTVTNAANKEVTYKSTTNKKAKTLKIPSSVSVNGETYTVTSIAAGAFKNHKTLQKVTGGTNIQTIGANAFSGCKKLKSVTISKNVTSIGDKAFYKCTALTKVTIPAKVTKIGKSAFEGCKKLSKITIKTSNLTSKNVGSKAFKGTPKKATVKVPTKQLKTYKKWLTKKGINKAAKIKK